MSDHPMQPVVLVDGVPRFKANAIVRYLLDEGPFNLDDLSRLGFSQEDYTQLMQLIGYSVGAYGDLDGSPPELVEKADLWAEELTQPVVAPDECDKSGDCVWCRDEQAKAVGPCPFEVTS